MKNFKNIILVLLLIICVESCTKKTKNTSVINYKDGQYSAISEKKDDRGGYAVVDITIANSRITACKLSLFMSDDKPKDIDYGKENGVIKNYGIYKIAQDSLKKSDGYGPQLVEVQDINSVDVIAGATISYDLFVDAVNIALSKAKE